MADTDDFMANATRMVGGWHPFCPRSPVYTAYNIRGRRWPFDFTYKREHAKVHCHGNGIGGWWPSEEEYEKV